MIRIESERNIDTLRQVARLLDRENQRLHEKVAKLLQENALLKGSDLVSAQRELEDLRALLAQREQALFGDSSEKRKALKEVEREAAPQKGHGPTPQKSLPVVEQIHTLDDPDRMCPQCGLTLEEMSGQYQESEEITVVERQFVKTLHRQKKYRCRCNGHIETAPGPVKLQEGGRYSPDFACEVAVSKYLDHTPLERQVRILSREGLEVTSQTLWDQTEVLSRLLRSTYEAIRKEILSSPVVGADETHWRVMGRSEETKRWWAWCLTSPRGAFFEILDSRSERSAEKVLQGYQGIVVADGYGAYAALSRGSPGFRLVNCWAHVRRKFVEIEENFPGPCQEILDLIAELYRVEAEVRKRRAGLDEDAFLRLLGEERQRRSQQIVSQIQAWALAQRTLPEGGLGKAVAYMLNLWGGLTAFLKDPRIPLDNNATERAIRGPVIGRKNFYGARSRRGTEVAAIFYTLFETAKLCGIEPKAYLKKTVRAALAQPGTVTLPNTIAPAA